MDKIELMKTHFVSISLDQANNILIAKWNGFLKLEELRQGCESLLRVLEDRSIKFHLSDYRDIKVLSEEVQQFLIRDWLPMIEKVGVNRLGNIVGDDVFAEITLTNTMGEHSTGKMIIEMFVSEEDCVKWLVEG